MKKITCFLALTFLISCSKVDELTKTPDLSPLEEGFRASAAIAYCVSIAHRAYTGKTIPENTFFVSESKEGYSNSGLIYVNIDEEHPLPFNTSTGQMIIAGLWDDQSGGVISILFGDVNVLTGDHKFYGLYTIPIIINAQTGAISAIFAEQDVVIKENSQTLLELGLSKVEFNTELDRLNEEKPGDVYTAVTQNVWHISINPGAGPDISHDEYEITGGGQFIEAQNNQAGVYYHAMINTKIAMSQCTKNPTYGTAFIQNIQAGSNIDFGNILLEFHSSCDGNAEVKLATGEYVVSNGRNIPLGW